MYVYADLVVSVHFIYFIDLYEMDVSQLYDRKNERASKKAYDEPWVITKVYSLASLRGGRRKDDGDDGARRRIGTMNHAGMRIVVKSWVRRG